jgi:hypothetical protein
VKYTIKICNTSSADAPALVKDSVSDSLIAGVDAAFGASLASGDCESHDFTRAVVAGDPDPLVNKATAHYHPEGFPNDITASDDHTVDLIHPSFTVAKSCISTQPIASAGPANFKVTIVNTGDVPLNIAVNEGDPAPFTLGAGATHERNVSVAGPFTPGGTANNTVAATWTLPAEFGLANTDTKSANASCTVQQVLKQATAYAKGTDAVCFTQLGAGSNNWGWVNGKAGTSIAPSTTPYVWDVWAGAAKCDTSKGTKVGTVTVVYNGTTVTVTFNILPQYPVFETHVYAGLTQIPPGGFSPGQYKIYGPFSGQKIYIIVHAVVGIP